MVEKILFAEHNSAKLRVMLSGSSTRLALQECIQYARSTQYIQAIDAKTVAWWDQHCNQSMDIQVEPLPEES